MAVNPMLTSGANSLQQSMKDLDDTAMEVAQMNAGDDGKRAAEPGSDVADKAEAMVELKLYTRQVQGTAKVIESADSAVGFLLDLRV